MDARAEEEFRVFVAARWHTLVRTAVLLTGDHGLAEDLVQQTLVIVHRRWGSILRQENPSAYARRVLVNENLRRFRRRRLVEVLNGGSRSDDPLVLDPADPGTPTDDLERRETLLAGLAALPPRMRAALVLRYFEDLSEAETAEALECSVGTVKSQCSRGLDRLRVLLGEPTETRQS